MAQQRDTIHIAEDSELAALLQHVDGAPVRLEANGVIYQVTREPDQSGTYDPKKVRAAVKATAGSWADIDIDALIEDLYRARDEGSRPTDRP